MSEHNGFSGTHIFIAFLAGAAAGAAVALLTTPTTGSENREKLRHAYDTARVKLTRAEKALEEKAAKG